MVVIAGPANGTLQGDGGGSHRDVAFRQAWQAHVQARRQQIQEDMGAGCITPGIAAQRIGWLDQVPDTSHARRLQAQAQRNGAEAAGPDTASDLAWLLPDVALPEVLPCCRDRCLLTRWAGASPELADDAWILARTPAGSDVDTPQVFWVQWFDDAGAPMGYRLTVQADEPMDLVAGEPVLALQVDRVPLQD